MEEVIIKTDDEYYFAGNMQDEPLFCLNKLKAWKVSKWQTEKIGDTIGYIEAHTGKKCLIENYN